MVKSRKNNRLLQIIRAIPKRWTMCVNPHAYLNGNLLFEFQKETCRRSQLHLQDVDRLSKPIPDEWFQTSAPYSSEALFYGALPVLLDYAGISFMTLPPIKLGIQHGYVFEICNWEKSKIEMRNLVWSKKLIEMYHEYTDNPDIFAIGAPFFYAKSLFNEDYQREEKKRLGHNLLAFPIHSETHVDTNYDPTKFINILIEQRKHFDTVRVCMYWKDILRGSHKVYEDAGFECVCNGHLYDLNFLRRQMTLFELADATISNGLGSHIGYSLYLGKPHWLVDDEYEYVNISKNGDAESLAEVSKKENFLRVKKAFLNNEGYLITKEQKDVIDTFWGISDIKTPSELKNLFMKLYGVS